jgi:hypothetical protein
MTSWRTFRNWLPGPVELEELPGLLVGEVRFDGAGPDDRSYEVIADFGEGRAYPETRWVCRGCP